MARIEISKGIPYLEVKKMAGELMIQNSFVSSVRVIVEKDTLKMCIEYTEFPKKVLDKLPNPCYHNQGGDDNER